MKQLVEHGHIPLMTRLSRLLAAPLALALITATGCLSTVGSIPAEAGDLSRTRVAYAGFAMVGSEEDLRDLYPFSAPLADEINRALLEKVSDLEPEHFDLYTTSLLDADEGNTVALAFALDYEKVSIERVAGVHKALIDISAQALVYDFDSEERAIIASYPVTLPAYIDVFDEAPSKRELAQRVRDYYLGGGADRIDSLLDEFVNVINRAPIKQKYAREIGIGQVIITPAAADAIDQTHDDGLLQQLVARRVAAELARQAGVSVIPFQVDSSVADLAMRFTGQRSATFLRLPEPDYLLDFAILDFKRRIFKQTDVGTTYLFATDAQVRVREPFADDRAMFKQFVRHALSKPVPITSGEIDGRTASLDSLWSLIARFSEEVTDPSRKWQKDQGLSSADRKEYRALGEALEQCK